MSNTYKVRDARLVKKSVKDGMADFDSLPFEYRELLRYSDINGYLDSRKVRYYEFERVVDKIEKLNRMNTLSTYGPEHPQA